MKPKKILSTLLLNGNTNSNVIDIKRPAVIKDAFKEINWKRNILHFFLRLSPNLDKVCGQFSLMIGRMRSPFEIWIRIYSAHGLWSHTYKNKELWARFWLKNNRQLPIEELPRSSWVDIVSTSKLYHDFKQCSDLSRIRMYTALDMDSAGPILFRCASISWNHVGD